MLYIFSSVKLRFYRVHFLNHIAAASNTVIDDVTIRTRIEY